MGAGFVSQIAAYRRRSFGDRRIDFGCSGGKGYEIALGKCNIWHRGTAAEEEVEFQQSLMASDNASSTVDVFVGTDQFQTPITPSPSPPPLSLPQLPASEPKESLSDPLPPQQQPRDASPPACERNNRPARYAACNWWAISHPRHHSPAYSLPPSVKCLLGQYPCPGLTAGALCSRAAENV